MIRSALLALVLVLATGQAGAGQRHSPPLLDPGQLADFQGMIVDIRPKEAFAAGHVPGAVSAPYGDFGWRTSRFGRPAVLPEPDDLARRVGRLGLARTTPVAIVAEEPGLGALVYWTMSHLGHDKLFLLDGGIRAWRRAGLNLERGEGAHLAPVQYVARPNSRIVADEAFVIDLFDNVRVAIDCRSELYWGGEKGGPAQEDFGTIQDALNLDSARLLNDEGKFRPLAELKRLFTLKGVIEDRTAFFGYDGRHAALCWFALYELIGNKKARIYDGGMTDWEKNGHDIWNLTDGMGAR